MQVDNNLQNTDQIPTPDPQVELLDLAHKLDRRKAKIDLYEQFMLDLVAKSATWLTPALPGFFVQAAVAAQYTELAGWVSWLIAYVIEALGLTTVNNSLVQWRKLQISRKRVADTVDPADPQALKDALKGDPDYRTTRTLFAVALLTAGFYVAVNVTLVWLLKVYPAQTKQVSTVMLSILSVVAAVGTVMRVWQMQQDKAEAEAAAAAEAAQRKAEEQAQRQAAEEQARRDREEAHQRQLDDERRAIELEKIRAMAQLEIEERRLALEAKRQKKLSQSQSSQARETETRSRSQPSQGVQPETVLDLLRQGYTVSDLPGLTGASRASVYRLLAEIAKWDNSPLTRTAKGSYQLRRHETQPETHVNGVTPG